MAQELEIVVAGAGIAGLTAGLYAARVGRKTLILSGDVLGGHLLSIEKIEGIPGFPDGVPGFDLCPMTEEQALAAGAEFVASEVERIEKRDGGWHIVTPAEEYMARAVILATGTHLKELGIPGEKRLRGKGVSHCASCDAPLLRGQPAVVVGGGDSAMQEALTLAEHASKVTILHRGDALSGQASYRDRVAQHPRIEVRYETIVEEILGDAAVTGVRLRDPTAEAKADLEAAGVFIYIGLAPNTAFVDGALSLTPSGHIPTDSEMRTLARGLFAAGTVRAEAAGQAIASAGDGAAAAKAADRYLNDMAWPG